MNSGIPMHSVLALNKVKYLRELINLPQAKSVVYITTNFETGSSDLLHYHDKSHLSFIVNGGIIDKRNNMESEISSGELMFFHAGELHQSIYKIFPTKNITLELETSFFQENTISEELLKLSAAKNPNAKFTMLKIYKELTIKDDFTDCSIELLLLNLIDDKSVSDHTRPIWINNVLELLNDNWNETVTLEDLAKVSNVNPITISKHFPKYISCTLGEYRRRLKIEKSLGFIKTSAFSLIEIAHKCGFSDQSHFTRTFKQLTGFLPRDYQTL